MNPKWLPFALLPPLMALVGCQRQDSPTVATLPVSAQNVLASGYVEALGLPNVYRITDKLYSGGSPDGDVGFASLQKLGVRTVLSVDGAAPDVERARKYGLRYVHIPIGYDGVTQENALRLAKAVRDLPGPIYIHCHHGKHRSPAAAAVVHRCLDKRCGVAAAVDEMRRAGTDPKYTGLYSAPGLVHIPTDTELDALPAEFPEVAIVPNFTRVMVAIDERWDRLKKVRAAGWKLSADHPDLDPPHEALQLWEQYREAGRLPEVQKRPDELRRWLADAEQAARDLEQALRPHPKQPGVDTASAEKAYSRSAAACSQCHARYRDVRQMP